MKKPDRIGARRTAVIFTIVVATAFVLAGCSGATTTTSTSATSTALDCHGCGDGKSINVLLENWGAPAGEQTAWENQVAKVFKKDTGATVNFSEYVGSTGEETAIETDSASKSGPDIFQVANSLVATANSAGVFSKITPTDWKLLGGKSRFLPQAYSQNLTGGTMVAQWLSDTIMAYNTKLFAEAGIKSPPTTWNAFVTDAKKITALGNGTYGVGFDPADPYDPWHEIYLLSQQDGGNLVKSSGTPGNLTSAAVEKATNFWFDFYTKFHIAPPASASWTQSQEMASFAQGKLGMLLLTTAQVESVSKGQPAQGNIAFAGMPSVPYGEKALPKGQAPIKTLTFSWNLGATSWSTEKPLDYRFLQIATGVSAEKLLATAYNEVPSTVAATAAEKNNSALAPSIEYMAGGAAPPALAYWGSVEVAVANAASALSRDIQNGSYNSSAIQSELQTGDAQINAAAASSTK